MEDEKMENAARETTCSRGIKKLEEEIERLSEKKDTVWAEIWAIEENSKMKKKEVDAIAEKINELQEKLTALKQCNKKLAEQNIEGKRRGIIVMVAVNPLEFLECWCGKDWRSCGHDGLYRKRYDLVQEVEDEDMTSHLPASYFKQK